LSQTKSKKKFRRSLTGTNGEEFSLESYLWDAANILRGHVDASDFKAYIFPLLFYKRISDVYDDEFKKAMDESKGDEDYAHSEIIHRFQIPQLCHWDDLRSKASNIGQFLQKSLRSIEKANPDTLFGIFGDVNWGNKEKITDELMVDLVEHFSKINLSNSNVKQDVLGDAYEFLIKRFADLQNKKAGEFYTPRKVVELLTRILDPDDHNSVYDPACGTGGMLLEAANHVKRKNQDIRKLKLFGQESNLNTAAIAKINLFLHGIDDFKISRGDTLRNPAFHDNDVLTQFDCVIANPPYSLTEWGHNVWKNDPYGRAFAGLPPEGSADFAWIQQMLSSVNDDGIVGVVISASTLYRPAEKKIRQKLIEECDYLVAIIQLGLNIFYGTGLAPCILIFKKNKSKNEKGNVLMINALDLYTSGRAQNFLSDEHIDEIFQLYTSRKEKKYTSKIVKITNILEQNLNLSVLRYIEPEPIPKVVDIDVAKSELKKSISLHRSFEKKLISAISKDKKK